MELVCKQEVLGKEFKIYGTIEEPLFLAKDVAEWIEHSDVSMMLKKIDEDEKIRMTNPNNVCGGQMAWFLTEDGLYEVLMQSRKPIAKQFKKQVKEILKSLRLNKIEMVNKTTQPAIDNQINDMVNLVKNLVDTVSSLTSQNTILMNKNNELLERMLDMKEEKETGYNDKIMETVSFEDDVEKEINSFQNVTMKLQDFCDFINSKGTVEKKLGIQLVNQLLRDNGIYDKYNNPIEEDNNYFVKDNQRYLITKYGMIMLYRLIKEQITFRYSVRR